jgi:dihydropteroate synthase
MNGREFKDWLNLYSQNKKNRSLIMGVLNVTPDSFSDGGHYYHHDNAVKHAIQLISDGADIIDIGGESSRPGSIPVSLDEELNRTIPILEKIREYTDCCISIDTYKSEVMQAALEAGADVINDIYALSQSNSVDVIRKYQAPVCIMHMHGVPHTMLNEEDNSLDMNQRVKCFFEEKLEFLNNAGISKKQIIIDPGIGFGKTTNQNLLLIKDLGNLQDFNIPILLGVSKKRFIGEILGKKVSERAEGTIVSNIIGLIHGARIFRVHDVAKMKDSLLMAAAIIEAKIDR